MKQRAAALLAVLLLAACASLPGQTPAPPPADRNTVAAAPEAVWEEPVYQFDTVSEEGKTVVASNDAAHYFYETLSLSVPNLEALSPEDAQAAERNIQNFNSRMAELMEDALSVGKAMGEDAAEMSELGELIEPYYDETFASFCRTGQIVSVRLDSSSYTGGAHPNSYSASQIFDLGTGRFVDPTRVADDPAAFQSGAAERLLEKAESLESRDAFWTDYAEIIARWNAGTVFFDGEGMLVIFSPYELGPYSIGRVELRLDGEELGELVGPGGLARLGMETETSEEEQPDR